MHKYDKRFTGGNQLAYGKCCWVPYNYFIQKQFFKSIRKETHKLKLVDDEDIWDKVLGQSIRSKIEYVDYY